MNRRRESLDLIDLMCECHHGTRRKRADLRVSCVRIRRRPTAHPSTAPVDSPGRRLLWIRGSIQLARGLLKIYFSNLDLIQILTWVNDESISCDLCEADSRLAKYFFNSLLGPAAQRSEIEVFGTREEFSVSGWNPDVQTRATADALLPVATPFPRRFSMASLYHCP